MNRIVLMLFIFFISQISIHSQASKENQLRKVSLQLKWHNQFQFAGYYVAKYKGYYEEVGLDVTIIEGGPDTSYEHILSGKYDYGVADSRILLAKMNKKPIIALAAIFQHTPDAIIMREDSKIRVPSQLINKKIMLGENSIPPSIQAIFLREGIPLTAFTLIASEMQIEAITNKKIDALIGYASNEPYQLETNGIDTVIFYPHDYGIDFYGDMLFTSEKEVENNREQVIAFLQASQKGWQFAMNNISETADLILDTPEIKKENFITKRYLLYEGKTLDSLILPNVVRIGHINPDRIRNIAETFKKIGLYKGDYSLEGFIFDPSTKVDSRWKKYLLFGTWAILPLIIVFTALIVILRKLVKIRTGELFENKKRLEELNYELEKSERKYKNLIENSKDIIFSLNGEGQILTINRAVKNVLRFSPAELVGKNFAELVYNPETESHIELYAEIFRFTIQEVIQSQGSITFNSDLTNKIGEPLEINITLQYVKMENDFMILGTASLVKEDDLLKFCVEENQVYKIQNYLNHVDAICHRLPNTALKHSDQETVFNIRICLRELLINAIEHGNLNISFNEKTKQQANGDYLQFLIAKQKEPKNASKLVTIEFSVNSKFICFRITDEGDGFDHSKMLEKKIDDTELQRLGHGRGIIMARDFYDLIEYNKKGNSVFLVKHFNRT